jgi:hypothetical protein
MGFYPVAVYYNNTHHTNNTPHSNTAHKTTQTIKDTLYAMKVNTPCNIWGHYILKIPHQVASFT